MEAELTMSFPPRESMMTSSDFDEAVSKQKAELAMSLTVRLAWTNKSCGSRLCKAIKE
jgi:hypothetical protein